MRRRSWQKTPTPRLALEEAQKLAEDPDAEPDRLAFLLRGLGPEEDPPQVRVLRHILRRTANEQVRSACLRSLAKWVSDPFRDQGGRA